MPETTENYHRVENPNFSGAAFNDEVRTQDISKEKGIKALWSPLRASGLWKVRTFLFAREKWAEMSACEQWVKEHREEFMAVGPGLVLQQTFEAPTVVRDTTPTEDELAVINERYALEALKPEEVYVRTKLLSNDQWGQHGIRLSRGFQRSLIETTEGRSLLLGHPHFMGVPSEPLGRFFAAEEWRDPDGITWNRTKFYMVKTGQNEHARKQIDGGVWQHSSIGMETDWQQCSICGKNIMLTDECPHVPGKSYPVSEIADDVDLDPQPDPQDAGNVLCGVILRGRGTTLEGSIVYWPELKGTQVIAAQAQAFLAGDFGTGKAMLLDGDGDAGGGLPPADNGVPPDDNAASGDGNESDEDNTPPAEEGDDMATPEELAAATKPLEDNIATLEAQVAELTQKDTDATAKIAALEARQKDAEAYRAFAVGELERLGGLLKREQDIAAFKEVAGEDLSGMSAERVLALVADMTEKFDAAHPAGRQSTGTAPDDNGEGQGAGDGSVQVRRLAFI